MGTYLQWKKSNRESSFYTVWGSQTVFVDEVLKALTDKYGLSSLSTFMFSALVDSEDIIRDCILSECLEDSRLVIIRHSDKLEFTESLLTRMKSNTSGVIVLQFDDKPDDLVIKSSKEVKCCDLGPQDLISWVRGLGNMKEHSAKVLIDWTDGNTRDLKAMCDSLSLVGLVEPWELSSSLLEKVFDETSSDFVDALIEDDKKRALESSIHLGLEEFPRIAYMLDYKISRIMEIANMLSQSSKKLSNNEFGNVPFAVVKELRPLVRKYPKKRIAKSRRALAVVDDAIRSGATLGVWEALIGLW